MRHPRTLVALTLTGLLLAGCSDDPAEAEPEPILPSSSSADPSGEPSASEEPGDGAPEMPAAAEERTFPGAEAFVRHWVEAFNFSTSTGDVDSVRALGLPSCTTCQRTADGTEEIYAGGGRIESEGWTVKRVGVTPSEGLDNPAVAAQIDRSPEKFIEVDPRSVERYPGGVASYAFTLTWRGEQWRVREIELLD